MKKDELEQKVTIKLKKWQIPYLLGAARLGIWNEDWCAALAQTSIGTYDTHSAKWILKVGHIIQQIKNQTGVDDEDKEYASRDFLNDISNLVGKQCKANEDALDKHYQELHEEDKKRKKTKEEIEAERKFEDQVVSIPITDEMLEEVSKKVEEVMAEIR